MAETKRKRSVEGKRGSERKSKRNGKTQRKKSGPRLPSSLQKELDRLNPITAFDGGDAGSIDPDDDNDIYEYEEEQAEEESRKNRRYDPASVDNDLSHEFEDENLQSDDENEDDDDDYIGKRRKRKENALNDDSGEEDDGRHTRMLQGITGMPSEAFEENKKIKMMKDTVIPGLYPESEYNPSRDVIDGDGHISVEDLLNPLRENPGYGKLRKRMQQIEKNARTVHAPLSKAVQAKVERKAAYEISKKDVTKWQHIIQKNREAPTIFFDENVDLGFSTVGAIASEFEPRTEFERKMAALVHDDKIMEAHKKDGSRLLEMNKVTIEDEKERQNRIAKMRSLLFHHEMKAKHIKKIKSRTFHRLLKKDRLKAESSRIQMDPEAAKEYAMKQERQRAEERMTLRHKNQNQWAKRILQRGLNSQDEGTRAALAEQLKRYAELTRKTHSMKGGSSSSEDTSDEDDENENSAGSDRDRDSKLLGKAKEKTMKVLEEEDEILNSGLLSLPFMRRGLKRRKEAAVEEANLALQDYEESLKKLDNSGGSEDPKAASASGRRVFGPAKAQISDAGNKVKSDMFYGSSDSEDELGDSKSGNTENGESNLLQKDVNDDSVLIQEDTDTHQESVFKSIDDIIKNPGPTTTYEVSIFASDTWKKAKNRNEDTNVKSPKLTGPVRQDIMDPEKKFGEDSDTDSEGQMVDGILSSVSKPSYEGYSQEETIRQVFAGDDEEGAFEKHKQEILNEENPEPQNSLFCPGWGQWTHIQQKRGSLSRMLKKDEDAQKKRKEALKKRKDARLQNVIITEKIDKRAEKLHTKALPYPFTSKEVFEQSMRVPIGPEFNPATAIGPLNRPEVVKRPGVIIKPIEFEEVNAHEKPDHRSGDKHRLKKNKGNGGKSMKKRKVEGKSK